MVLYNALSLKLSNTCMPVCNKEITQFYHPPTHTCHPHIL